MPVVCKGCDAALCWSENGVVVAALGALVPGCLGVGLRIVTCFTPRTIFVSFAQKYVGMP